MGLFSTIRDAAATANQEAHGDRLLREFDDSVRRMSGMPREQSDRIIAAFVGMVGELNTSIWNWTSDGKLKAAKSLREEARKVTDFDVIKGYALWMSSAWLESQARSSEKAKVVFTKLDELARAHQRLLDEVPVEVPSRSAQGAKVAHPPMPASDMLIGLTNQVMHSIGIELLDSGREGFLNPDELSEKEAMTIAAAVFGLAASVAMESGARPESALAVAVELVKLYGIRELLARAGTQRAIEEYQPNPTGHFGIAAYRAAEAYRRFRQGVEEFNAMYCVSWVLDHEW